MSIPVYLFTGFLESGKSTLIKESLFDPEFNDGGKTLFIMCEDGEAHYDSNFLHMTQTIQAYVDDQETLNEAFLKELHHIVNPRRVMIEFNGMWNVTAFLNHLPFPDAWSLVQIVSTVDATSFTYFVNNMRALVYDQLIHSETIIINRCNALTDLRFLRNTLKAMNKRVQLMYEGEDGSLLTPSDNVLSYDLQADHLQIANDDYGVWYIDALEHPSRYVNKTIILQGWIEEINPHLQSFHIGRYAKVCCAQDTTFIGLPCSYAHTDTLQAKTWCCVHGVLQCVYDEVLKEDKLQLNVKYIELCELMNDAIVYFT